MKQSETFIPINLEKLFIKKLKQDKNLYKMIGGDTIINNTFKSTIGPIPDSNNSDNEMNYYRAFWYGVKGKILNKNKNKLDKYIDEKLDKLYYELLDASLITPIGHLDKALCLLIPYSTEDDKYYRFVIVTYLCYTVRDYDKIKNTFGRKNNKLNKCVE